MEVFELFARKWSLLLDKRSKMNQIYFTSTFVGLIVCFSPFISNTFYGVNETDDSPSSTFPIDDEAFNVSSMACLIIVIPSFVDLLIDFVLMMHNWYFHMKAKDTQLKPEIDMIVFRFTMAEKLLFISGIASFSVAIFPPQNSDKPLILLSYCMSNFSAVCLAVSVTIFLERTTEEWTPFRALMMILSICIGSSLCSVSYCIPVISQAQHKTNLAGNVLLVMGSVFYLITCFLCLLSYFRQKRRERRVFTNRSSSTSEAFEENSDPMNYKTFENSVPFCYMVSFIIFAIVNILIVIYPTYISAYNYCFVGGATLILVTEMRVRKTELYAALVSNNLIF